ncbi:hypothetical protein ACIA3K_03720 [Micromonospora sp. NPDC051543]|uniref:hypothetical protein n=1 Tax=Micromonospora sp. NPDC051543 TaxID=3364287 RepID=UPI00378DFF46
MVMKDSETVGVEYLTGVGVYDGPSDFASNPRTFHRPVELGTAIRFSTPPLKSSEYREELNDLKKAVKKGRDPGLEDYQRNDLVRLVEKMKSKTPPLNANQAFVMMWHLRNNVRGYPLDGPMFQKIEAFYNLHSPQLVHDGYHRPSGPHGIEPPRSPGEVAAGDVGPEVSLREKFRIGTTAFVGVAALQMTGAAHFSHDGDESLYKQVKFKINETLNETRRTRGLKK